MITESTSRRGVCGSMTSRGGFCTKTVPPGRLCTIHIRAIESLAQIYRKLKVFWLQLTSIRQSYRILPRACSRNSTKIPASISATTPCRYYAWLRRVDKGAGLISNIYRLHASEGILALLYIKYQKTADISHAYHKKFSDRRNIFPVHFSPVAERPSGPWQGERIYALK